MILKRVLVASIFVLVTCGSGRCVNTTKTKSVSPHSCVNAECTSPFCVNCNSPNALVQQHAGPLSCGCPMKVTAEKPCDDAQLFDRKTTEELVRYARTPRLQRKRLTPNEMSVAAEKGEYVRLIVCVQMWAFFTSRAESLAYQAPLEPHFK